MTIVTMLWPTDGVGDGTATGYTDAQTQGLFRALHLTDPTAQGVLAGQENELAVTSPGANQISVATGQALIYGIHLKSDATVSLAPTTPAATTGGLVYAKVDWTGTPQTGDINFRQSTSGDTGIPALVQTPGTAYEIPLASYQIDNAGSITLIDLRQFAPGTNGEILARQGGDPDDWSVAGNTNYDAIGRIVIQTGVKRVTVPTGNISGLGAITFPVAFSQPPIVLVSAFYASSSTAQTAQWACTYGLVQATQVGVEVTRQDYTTTTGDEDYDVNWIAIGLV